MLSLVVGDEGAAKANFMIELEQLVS